MELPVHVRPSPQGRARRSVASFAVALLLGAVMTPLLAGSAFADPQPVDCTTDTSAPQCADLTPVTTCDWNNGDGSYTAVFGYRNDSSKTILVGIGSNNQFSPSSGDRGQITSFPSGSATSSFTVRWDGSPLTWKLATKTLTTSSSGTQCPAPPVPALGEPWILIGFLVVSFLVIVMAWRDRGAPPRSPQPQPLPVPAGSDPR